MEVFSHSWAVRYFLSILLTAALVLMAASVASAAPRSLKTTGIPQASGSLNAEVIAPTVARKAPRTSARVAMKLSPSPQYGAGLTTLQVTRRVVRPDGSVWYRVRLNKRPAKSQGWVEGSRLRISRNPLRVVVRTKARTLTVYRNNRRVMRTKIAVGKGSTPTPHGRFAITEKIWLADKGSFLGPVVMPLTGYSETLDSFMGGDAQIGLHGTNSPSRIGKRSTSGCAVMSNKAALKLAKLIRPGTPVLIRG